MGRFGCFDRHLHLAAQFAIQTHNKSGGGRLILQELEEFDFFVALGHGEGFGGLSLVEVQLTKRLLLVQKLALHQT